MMTAGIKTSAPRSVFGNRRFGLGESPVWSVKHQQLVFVDQAKKHIHVYKPETGELRTIQTPETPPAVVLTEDPNVVVSPMEQHIAEIDISQQGCQVRRLLATVPEQYGSCRDGWRFNDCRAAPGGQIIAGRMSEQGWEDGEGGYVFKLQPPADGAAKAELTLLFNQGRLVLPNGLSWNTDKGYCYYADTYRAEVYAIPCGPDGTPSTENWRTLVKFDAEKDGMPDGMAIDATGNLWIAHEQGGKVTCHDAETGDVLHTIDMPVKRISAVAFGGPDLKQLYITTISEEGEDASPDSGKLFVVDLDGVAGIGGAHMFGACGLA